jgi:hypothetical protein
VNGLLLNLLRDIEPRRTELQQLQLALLDLIRRAREADERTATAFSDFMLAHAAREAARKAA